MIGPRHLAVALLAGLFICGATEAATIVNSTWLSGGDFSYSTAANWSPPEVPNNSADKLYNVTAKFSLVPDIDATVANLTMQGAGLSLSSHSYTVTGTTTLSPSAGVVLSSYSPAGAILKTSNLSNFSNGALTKGYYSLTQGNATAGQVMLQFNGAAVTKLQNANLTLNGPMARLADEFGRNALTTLAEIDALSRFSISAQQFVTTAGVFTNDGELAVSGGLNPPAAFVINGTLSNFDSHTKTLLNGTYEVNAANLSFPGADIVNNGASITLGAGAAITDETGADALRNFAHTLPSGSLMLQNRDLLIDRDFSNAGTLGVDPGSITVAGRLTNDGTVSARAEPSGDGSITISGGLANYDPQSKRLTGGTYTLVGFTSSNRGFLSVPGIDVVHNSASINLTGNALFFDENGNDALRNFADNESVGLFSLFSHAFQATSDFTNAGTVLLTETKFTLPAGSVYRQTSGQTTISAPAISGDVVILGGQLSGRPREFSRFSPNGGPGTINGNLTMGAAVFDPNPMTVNGSLQLSDTSRFRKTIGHITYGLYEGLLMNTPLTTAGSFEILTPGGFAPSSSTVYQVAHAPQITGTFSNAPNGARVPTLDGTGSFVITYTSTDISISGYQRSPSAQLLNISTRAHVLTGDNVAIGGFIVKGTQPKKLLLRAMGPSLAAAGVSGSLQDPTIELHDSTGAIIASNDNWQDTQASAITDTGIPPSDARESAILQTLPPGTYTAVVRGKNDATGEALVELYDLTSSQSRLTNISTRGFVDSGHVLIGGLIAGGDGQSLAEVLVRAIGRGLQYAGVQNFLPDTTLQVRDKNGALVAANDDFGSPADNRLTIPAPLTPSIQTDAATRIVVPPGSYTVVVNGKNGASGNALVEIYDLNP